MANFYYAVIAKIIKQRKGNGELEFSEFRREFENDNPIIARNEAFNFYQNYIEVLLQSKGLEYVSDRQAQEDLGTFIGADIDSTVQIGEDLEMNFKGVLGTGIGVFLICEKLDCPETEEELLIHGLGSLLFSSGLGEDNLAYNLEREYEEYYKKQGLDTQNQETKITYFNQEEWAEGYLGNGKWRESYFEPQTYTILNTPFDWTGYDKEYWWKEREEETSQVNLSMEELIAGGETNQVEFKPSLVYNFNTDRGGIGVKGKIADAICAFLNANGGILFIGLDDDGKAIGLSHDYSLAGEKKEKDFFRLEFDDTIRRFFSFSIKSLINHKFYEYQGKEIFTVVVQPSKNGPVFKKGQDGKEFYVRGAASSMPLRDVEEIVEYCLRQWGNK